MIANRISFYLKLKGPSMVIDTACSSSLTAIEHAFKAIRQGECDSALVAGCSLCLHPNYTLQFSKLHMMSPEGKCKVFDQSADGYVRSEAIACVFLQKASKSRRIYARILHAKCNNDGFTEQGITFPSSDAQRQLMEEVYKEAGVDPCELCFIEVHGTGTPVGDPEELEAIDRALAKNRSRKNPLYIGSVKSNCGHSEPASGVCSLTKVLIAMETGFVPPNIHFIKPKKGMEGLEKGRLKVVTEKLALPHNNVLIGINSFGIGGTNCHVLLQWNPKGKLNSSLPSDELPRLVCVSGRVNKGVETILDNLKCRLLDSEFIWLLQQLFNRDFPSHHFRGFSILTKKEGEVTRSFRRFLGPKPSLVFALSRLDNWRSLIGILVEVPTFACCLSKIQGFLVEKNVYLKGVIYEHKPESRSCTSDILGSVVVQLCLLEVLKFVKIVPDFVVGRSIGLLVCGFVDGCLTFEQTLLLAYELSTKKSENFEILQKFKEILPNPIRKTKKWIIKTNLVTAKFLLDEIFAETNEFPAISSNSLILDFSNSKPMHNFPQLSLTTVKSSISFLELIGNLYENGFNPQVQNLYPEIQTVSRGTQMIAPLVKWNHEKPWFVCKFQPKQSFNYDDRKMKVDLRYSEWEFLTGHVIEGKMFFPVTGYLFLVWDFFAKSLSKNITDLKVVFENCYFFHYLLIPKDESLEFSVNLQKSGNFELLEKNNLIMKGQIFSPENFSNYQLNNTGFWQEKKNLVMKSSDIYKELRLRGYNFKKSFQGLVSSNLDFTSGSIKWDGNWITFLENMILLTILKTDTRLLNFPKMVRTISIDPKKHLSQAENLGQDPTFPVYINKESGIIKSGSIEIRGLLSTLVGRNKMVAKPVLEKYVFVPNKTSLSLEESLRVNLQLILENVLDYCFKTVEVIDKSNQMPLSPIILKILEDIPLVQPNLMIFTKQPLTTTIRIKDKKLATETNCLLVIGTKILQTNTSVQQVFGALHINGFVLSKEELNYHPKEIDGLDIVTLHTTETEKFVMFRKRQELAQKIAVVDVGYTTDFKWLAQIQNATKISDEVVVFTQNEPLSGILGLVNCIRREPNGNKFKCFFILDEAPKFTMDDSFYKKQHSKHLAVNVYKNSQWGTYRHLVLEDSSLIESEHCLFNASASSSLKLIKGPLNHKMKLQSDEVLVDVYYSGLNFREIMTISGLNDTDVLTMNRLEQGCMQYLELSGRASDGTRVMGIVPTKELSNLVVAEKNLLIPVPDHWSLEEAATVPVAYSTVIYSLLVKGCLTRGQSILIHSGSSDIGIAAITLSLFHGCNIFTTVGSQKERDVLLNHFPQLKRCHIGNSRDTSFMQMIKRETKGRGVDLVLNSLMGDKLIASIQCLAHSGIFLETNKFQSAKDNTINLLLLEKNASFHGCMFNNFLFDEVNLKRSIIEHICKALENGSIKPLPRTIFKINEVKEAFKFMASGKHVGKIVVKMQDKAKVLSQKPNLLPCLAHYTCNGDKVNVIVGGLGGIGLELADWLVLRGAKKLVLTSRVGIQTGYQAYRIKAWKSHGVSVNISTSDITTRHSCFDFLKTAQKLGEIEAVFNLAVVLKDALLENQTVENFFASFKPKAIATKFLDEATRKLCPFLRHFVVFSSMNCGRGSVGQANYGMANSVIEKICEQRNLDNFPALAVQFGAVGEVGLMVHMQERNDRVEFGGTQFQQISNCLDVLEKFLHFKHPVVSSLIVGEKKSSLSKSTDIIETIASVLEIRNIKSISLHVSLAELGMDSVKIVEVRQTLERMFNICLKSKVLRRITLNELQKLKKYSI